MIESETFNAVPTTHGIAGVSEAFDDVPRDRDSDLALRAAAGGADAIRAIYEEHAGAVAGFVRHRMGICGDASDVVQEVFMQFWKCPERYDPSRSSLRSWLIVIARSRALDALRSEGARAVRESRYTEADLLLRGGQEDRGEAADRSELHRRVRAALASLPEKQRRCVELAYFGELTHAQVAEVLGQPLGTVKSRILLGVKKLRRLLAD